MILSDYCNAVKVVRRAHKHGLSGKDIRIEATAPVPVIRCSCWLNSVEAGIFFDAPAEIYRTVKQAFAALDKTTQHALTFSPKPGEYAQRAKFWKGQLKPALTPVQYMTAMQALFDWFKHCIRMGYSRFDTVVQKCDMCFTK